MAAILDNVRARPALLSVVVAVAFHGAVVAALPRRHAHPHTLVAPRPQEVEVARPHFQAMPPAAPPLARAAVAALGGGEASAPARALLNLARREAPPAPPAPAAVESPLAGDFVLPQAPASGQGGGTSEAALPPGLAGLSAEPALAAPPSVTPIAVLTPDRSRPASLMHGESWSWSCPWPNEADAIDDAVAVVQITVGPAGRAARVDVVKDPGYGFGREARKCALRETYAPALDRDGRAVLGITKPIRVRFAR